MEEEKDNSKVLCIFAPQFSDLYLSWFEQQTHNLEVRGSSPSWSTLKIKHLQSFCRCFFLFLGKQWENTLLLKTP